MNWTAEERTALVTETPWKIGVSTYKALQGIHQPWIAEISNHQYATMSKAGRARYDKQRAEEWQTSADGTATYRDAVLTAYKEGKWTPLDEDAHEDAREVVRWYWQGEQTAAFDAALRTARLANELHDFSTVKPGDQVYSIMSGQVVTVLKVSRLSLRVQARFGESKERIGAVQKRNPNDVRAEVVEQLGYDPYAKPYASYPPYPYARRRVRESS